MPHDWSELVNRIGFLEDLSLFKKDSTWTISFLHKKSEILNLTSFQLDETTDNVVAYRVYENLRHQQDAVNYFLVGGSKIRPILCYHWKTLTCCT